MCPEDERAFLDAIDEALPESTCPRCGGAFYVYDISFEGVFTYRRAQPYERCGDCDLEEVEDALRKAGVQMEDEGEKALTQEVVAASTRWANEMLEGAAVLLHRETTVIGAVKEVGAMDDGEPFVILDTGDKFLARPGNFFILTPQEEVSARACATIIAAGARQGAQTMKQSGMEMHKARAILAAVLMGQLRAIGAAS